MHSLEAERRHAEIKNWESSKLKHITTASRNAIIKRHLMEREAKCDLLAAARRELHKLARTNVQALAWQQPDAIRPVGQLFSASRQPASTASGVVEHSTAPGVARQALVTAAVKAQLLAQKADTQVQLQRNVDRLLESFLMPVTRPQWEQWLAGCISEFRALMVSAPLERRQHSMRLRERLGFPVLRKLPHDRLQPIRATKDDVRVDWACNLRRRTGWHSLKTRDHGNLFVLTIVFLNVTRYIDLSNQSTIGKPPTCLLDLVCINDTLHDLSYLETLLTGDVVTEVLGCDVRGVAAGELGVSISVLRTSAITKPLPASKTPKANDDGEGSDVDEAPAVVGCEAEPATAVVCSAGETDGEDESEPSEAEGSGADLKAKVLKVLSMIEPDPTIRATRATSDRLKNDREALWQNAYFTIPSRDKTVLKNYLIIRIRTHGNSPTIDGGMGKGANSKQYKPFEFGEPFDNPVRTLLVLRTWGVCRARQSDWAIDRPDSMRKQTIDDEEASIEHAVRALNEPCHLLGDITANIELTKHGPDLVARLRASAAAAAAAAAA